MFRAGSVIGRLRLWFRQERCRWDLLKFENAKDFCIDVT